MISPTEREREREEREACSGEGGGGPEVLLLRLLPNLLLRCGVDTYYLQVDGTWPTAASCWVPENSGDGVKTSGNEEQLFFREGEGERRMRRRRLRNAGGGGHIRLSAPFSTTLPPPSPQRRPTRFGQLAVVALPSICASLSLSLCLSLYLSLAGSGRACNLSLSLSLSPPPSPTRNAKDRGTGMAWHDQKRYR